MAEDKIVIPGEWVEMTLKMSDREAGAFIKAICIYYFDREEKEIFEPSNGITLCEKCHRRLHKNER